MWGLGSTSGTSFMDISPLHLSYLGISPLGVPCVGVHRVRILVLVLRVYDMVTHSDQASAFCLEC